MTADVQQTQLVQYCLRFTRNFCSAMSRRCTGIKEGAVRWGIALALLLSCMTLEAQQVNVQGGFFEDSIIVGDKVRFYLSAHYPSELNILFPDSTFDFAPFEYERRDYFPTHTTNGVSADSIVYYLTTFEVDRVQRLDLPVFQVNEKDCTVYESPVDTVLLTALVTRVDTLQVETLPLKESLAYQKVRRLFNYPVLVIATAILLTLTAVTWFVFGKKIRKHFRIKRMLKAHQEFIMSFTRALEGLRENATPPVIESTLAQWKKYIERLERKPYTKLTTREIQRMEKDELLGKTLHAIDGAIYGHGTNPAGSMEQLRTFADQRFRKRLEEVKHG